uniref:Uncharacterized protein n=1 Tax=Anguilla anguilla TaxID=7936 RepID=A0A0E9WWK8_ANGAN
MTSCKAGPKVKKRKMEGEEMAFTFHVCGPFRNWIFFSPPWRI